MKLVALSLGGLATALPLLFLLALPEPQPPSTVERIDLRAPRAGEQTPSGSAHSATAGPPRHRYGRGDQRAGGTAHGREGPKGTPTPASASPGDSTPAAHRAAPERIPAAHFPALGPRRDSVPTGGRPPTPRGTPVSGAPPFPGASPPGGAPPPEPPEPPDPPDQAATSATVDPPEEPEPADGDPEEPEAADGEPLM